MSVHSWWSPKTENIKGVRPYLSLFHSVIFSIQPTLYLLKEKKIPGMWGKKDLSYCATAKINLIFFRVFCQFIC